MIEIERQALLAAATEAALFAASAFAQLDNESGRSTYARASSRYQEQWRPGVKRAESFDQSSRPEWYGLTASLKLLERARS